MARGRRIKVAVEYLDYGRVEVIKSFLGRSWYIMRSTACGALPWCSAAIRGPSPALSVFTTFSASASGTGVDTGVVFENLHVRIKFALSERHSPVRGASQIWLIPDSAVPLVSRSTTG